MAGPAVTVAVVVEMLLLGFGSVVEELTDAVLLMVVVAPADELTWSTSVKVELAPLARSALV